jgi:hypothetical protein
MDLDEMTRHLEGIARDETVAPSARVRAIEVLARIAKGQTDDDREWAEVVKQFGGTDAE